VARPGQPVGGQPLPPAVLRVTAGSDLHCDATPEDLRRLAESAEAARTADLVLLAGDLTASGLPTEARAIAELFADFEAPVVAVLGNHDLRGGGGEVEAVLGGAGIRVLRSEPARLQIAGAEVGIVGTTGCRGGFHGRPVPGLSRPERRAQRELVASETAALEDGLRAVAGCAPRIVLMHYSPTADTLQGEPRKLLPLLGCDRLAGPIAAYQPDVVVHGHAHHGTLRGQIGRTPVFNVSVAGFHDLELAA
jgi:Icc-related predicted phosphoesterase